MTLLRSKATRVFFSDNGILSDLTEAARTWGLPSLPLDWVATEDALYIGRPHKFSYLYLALSQANSNAAAMSVRYWDGTAWTLFTDLLDETAGLSASGFVTWEENPEWEKAKPSLISGLTSLASTQELFWVKVSLSANTSAGTAIRAIKKLLSDDRLLVTIHPEIMQYLPSGQTDFLPQHELAKESIVSDLTMNGAIAYEDQIKNPEDYLLAASYKCIELILAPIPGDERLAEVKKLMMINYKSALKKSAAEIDTNKNEVLDEKEKEPGFVTHLTR